MIELINKRDDECWNTICSNKATKTGYCKECEKRSKVYRGLDGKSINKKT